MIHGPTMCRANTKRTAQEKNTMAVSHAQPGAATSLLRTDADLAQPLGDLREVGHAQLCRSFGDSHDDDVVDGGAAGRGLDCRHVRVGNAAEIVLARDVRARSSTEYGAVIGCDTERSLDR